MYIKRVLGDTIDMENNWIGDTDLRKDKWWISTYIFSVLILLLSHWFMDKIWIDISQDSERAPGFAYVVLCYFNNQVLKWVSYTHFRFTHLKHLSEGLGKIYQSWAISSFFRPSLCSGTNSLRQNLHNTHITHSWCCSVLCVLRNVRFCFNLS